jgi:hypothetical protein
MIFVVLTISVLPTKKRNGSASRSAVLAQVAAAGMDRPIASSRQRRQFTAPRPLPAAA